MEGHSKGCEKHGTFFLLLLLIFNLLFDVRSVYMGYNHYYAGYTDCCL